MKKLMLVLMLLTSTRAWSLVEARLTYGALASNPNLSDVYTGTNAIPSATLNYGLGGDFIFSPPLTSLGFGMRYENLGLKLSGNGLDFDSSLTRTAVIVNYRIINTLLFVGPIFTYGLSHTNSMKISVNGNQISNFSSSSPSSWSAGVEAGAKLVGIMVGAEAGYQSLLLKDATDSMGAVSGSKNIDLSGSYLKLIVGFSI